MEETNEISLQEIFFILLDKVLYILCAVLIGGLIAWGWSSYMIAPTYTSSITMYVYSNQNPQNTVANISDINASQRLVSTYVEILKSDNVLNKVSHEIHKNYTAAQLRGMLSASSVNGTEIFQVKVTAKDPEEAAYIANTIAKVAPAEIIRVVKAGSVELIDEAIPATAPTAPNITMNTLIGMMIGGVLSILGVLVASMLDNRIKDEEDLKKYYDFPVLGSIPDLEEAQYRIK